MDGVQLARRWEGSGVGAVGHGREPGFGPVGGRRREGAASRRIRRTVRRIFPRRRPSLLLPPAARQDRPARPRQRVLRAVVQPKGHLVRGRHGGRRRGEERVEPGAVIKGGRAVLRAARHRVRRQARPVSGVLRVVARDKPTRAVGVRGPRIVLDAHRGRRQSSSHARDGGAVDRAEGRRLPRPVPRFRRYITRRTRRRGFDADGRARRCARAHRGARGA